METRVGEAKEQGRRLPKVERDLRRVRRPCSGRTEPVPHFCACGGEVRGLGVSLEGGVLVLWREKDGDVRVRRLLLGLLRLHFWLQ